MICLENENISVQIKLKGAELISLFNKKTNIEHIWQADPAFWGKSSPVLFPIVGGLKDNAYLYKGKSYELSRHGFARDKVFELESKSETEATFLLRSNEETLEVYPFNFELRLIYRLSANKLSVSYTVKNLGDTEMYFSLGGHPAFAVPFDKEESYDKYALVFSKDEELNRWPLNVAGLIKNKPTTISLENGSLPITKELFYDDALVFKDLKSNSISIKSKASDNYLKFNFEGFPYFGIWAAKDADFVCLEPWCGIADAENHNQDLKEKEGINKLEVNGGFERTWSVEVG